MTLSLPPSERYAVEMDLQIERTLLCFYQGPDEPRAICRPAHDGIRGVDVEDRLASAIKQSLAWPKRQQVCPPDTASRERPALRMFNLVPTNCNRSRSGACSAQKQCMRPRLLSFLWVNGHRASRSTGQETGFHRGSAYSFSSVLVHQVIRCVSAVDEETDTSLLMQGVASLVQVKHPDQSA